MKTKPRLKQSYSDTVLDYVTPSGVSNGINHLIGLVFLVLNKIRHELLGYTSTRGFSSDLIKKVVSFERGSQMARLSQKV